MPRIPNAKRLATTAEGVPLNRRGLPGRLLFILLDAKI